MSPIALHAAPAPVTRAELRPLLGADVVVRTNAGATSARLLSVVRDSAWFVSGDADLVLHLDEIRSIRTA
jgi:hypothetical protein